MSISGTEHNAMLDQIDALLQYAQRIEDHFLALAGTVSQAEVDRALKEISAEKAVCFSPTPHGEQK